MYNIDQIAAMDRNTLIDTLNDAENKLNQIQQVLDTQNEYKIQQNNLERKCEGLQKKIKGLPFIPGIIVSVILALFSNIFLLVLIAVIAAAVLYKKNQKPSWEEELIRIQKQQIPELEMKIQQCDANLRVLASSAAYVKSLLSMLPENLRNIESIRGIRDQLLQGARDWYSARQGYESVLARQEQARQMREMQANVKQMTENSERTVSAMEDVRKQTKDIVRNTARSASAAEAAAQHSARAAAAAESSAYSNEQQARAAERTAAASERTAKAAEEAAYWIRYN